MGGIYYTPLAADQTSFGGPFDMVDHDGKVFSERDLLGRFALIYFGYTDCPDACPTTLLRVAKALQALGEAGKSVRPVFVNVDPVLAADRPGALQRLRAYVGYFHADMLGLTGSDAQIEHVKKTFQVSFATSDTGGRRIISHSSYLYLLAPDGGTIAYLPPGIAQDELSAALTQLMAGAPAGQRRE